MIKRINGRDIASFLKTSKTGEELLKMPAIREVEFFNGNHALHRDAKLKDGSIVTFGDDITEIKKRENELTVIRNAVDNSPIRILMADKDGIFTFINQSAKENFEKIGIQIKVGDTREEMRRKAFPYLDFEKQSDGDNVDEVIANRNAETDELSYDTRTNYLKTGEVSLIKTRKLNDGSFAIYGVDITDLKNKEYELERLIQAIDVQSNPICLWDANHDIVFANQSYKSMINEVSDFTIEAVAEPLYKLHFMHLVLSFQLMEYLLNRLYLKMKSQQSIACLEEIHRVNLSLKTAKLCLSHKPN